MTTAVLHHIACLFYAIAKADSSLSFEEYKTLSEALEAKWNHMGHDNIQFVKNEFNQLQKKDLPSELCFNKFVTFLHKHPALFSKALRALILETANTIAYAFAKINKSELHYMAKLSLEFKKTER